MIKTGLIIFIAIALSLVACGADNNNEELKISNTALDMPAHTVADAKENEAM